MMKLKRHVGDGLGGNLCPQPGLCPGFGGLRRGGANCGVHVWSQSLGQSLNQGPLSSTLPHDQLYTKFHHTRAPFP